MLGNAVVATRLPVKDLDRATLAIVGKQAGSLPLLPLDTPDCLGDYNALKARGVTFNGEPETDPWGAGVLLEDLYGNNCS
jgi:hypothetical protein